MQLDKILCSVDLSDHSKQVAEYAVMLARAAEAKLLVVYVAPSLLHYAGFHVSAHAIDQFADELVTGAEQAMKDFVTENFSGLADVQSKVLVGYAAEEILAQAEQEKVDLIVMGTHGRKGVDRILFGSVAEKVVKSAKQPVLTIRPAR